MKSFNTSEKSLSDSSNSNEANSIKNENNNINLNLNYPLFLNKNDSDSFDDDEDSSKEKEEESLKNNNSVNQIVNEAQNKIIQQFVENNLFNLIGGNKSYLLDIFKHYPEEKMWCVTCLTKGGFTQDFTAFELFEFLCDKIKKNLDLDDYRIYHKDFQDIPQFGIIKFFNILSEFLDEYYQSSIFEQKKIEKQNNNQFNQYNQCNQNHNQNNNNNYEKINNWIHTNFNICNNNDNNF